MLIDNIIIINNNIINNDIIIINESVFLSFYVENYYNDLFAYRHIDENTNNLIQHKQFNKCLCCNIECNMMIKGDINVERTCAICLESDDVCYGCKNCIDKKVPSCCIKCFNNMQK